MTHEPDVRVETPPQIVVYGDFNCPWSYLASRRAGVLEAGGLRVDWRAVEHDPRTPARQGSPSTRFAALHEEMDRVLAMLVPGERLPYDLAGFVPRTDAAVAAYAESHVAQVPARVRRVLFDSYWMHGIDIGDARLLRTLLIDDLRGSPSPSEAVRDWGFPVDGIGGPVSTAAWRVIARWAAEWREAGKQVVPMVQVPDAAPLHGVDAVEWLGQQILDRGLDPDLPNNPRPEPPSYRELPDLHWVAANGGRWLRRCQQAARTATASR
jgi:hypothetical protein